MVLDRHNRIVANGIVVFRARLTLGFVLPQVQMTREDLVKVDQAQALGTKPDGQLAGEALVPRLVPKRQTSTKSSTGSTIQYCRTL